MSFQLLIKTAQPPGPVTGATAAWTSPNTYVSCSWTPTQQYGGVPTITYTVVFYSSPTTNPANGTIVETFTGLSLSTTSAQTITTTLVSGLYYFAIIYAVNSARTSVGATTNRVNPSFASISPPTNVAITWDQYNTYLSASWTASSGAVLYKVTFYSNSINSVTGGTFFQTLTTSSITQITTATLTLNTYYYVAVQAQDSGGNYTAYTTSPTAVLYYVLPPTNVAIAYDLYHTYVTASWTGITNALTVTYTVNFYQNSTNSTSGGSLYNTITGLSVGTTSQITTTTLNFGNYYYATVAAYELGVSSAVITSSTAVLYYIPYPTNFTMVWNGTSYVYATWTIDTFSLPIYYTINFYTSGANVLSGGSLVQTFTNIGSSSNSQLTTTALSYNQYYYATIYTTISGTSSNSITVTTSNNVYYYFTPPTSVSLAWTNSYIYLTASWTYATINPAYTTLYNIYFYWNSTNASTGGTLVQTVLGTSNNYQNTTVTLSNGYYYAIVNSSNSVGTTSANVTTNVVNYAPTYWLTLGSGNNALMKSQSYSGITYYADGNPFGSTGYAAAWNGAIWVAVGSATNTISYSYDGVTWNGLGAGTFNAQGRGVAWNGSQWVAVGSAGNTIAYSSTGTSWNGAGLVFSTVGYGIAWNGSIWVAVGQGASAIYTSANGASWTASSNQSGVTFTTSANGGVWNGSIWVVGGSGTNTIATSVDGSVWISRGIVAGSTTVWCVAWSGSYFIAACAGTSPVITSPDGITWTGRTASGLTVGYFITVQNSGIWVLSGQGSSTIFTCTDGTGVTWTARTANTIFTTCYSVCYNGNFNYWIGVGTGTYSIAYSSTNAQTWTGASTLNSIIGVGYGVTCDGGTWIAVGSYQSQGNFTMATSTNGSSWTGFTAAWNARSVMQQLRSINYINNLYIVTGQGGAVYYSTSLTSNAWVSGAANPLFGPSTTVYNIAWNGNYSHYLAFSSLTAGVTVGLSPDLYSWASVAQIMFATAGYSITWNGSYFLATGQGTYNTLARSTDGYGWRGLGVYCFPTVAYSAAWNSQNSVWAVVGQGGVASIWTSGDGYNFYPRTSMIYATTFNSVRYQYTANMFTAVGTGGMIVRAYGTATTWQPTMQTAAWTNYNLAYGNGSWVASGASGFIVSSNVYEGYNDGAPALTDWVPRSIYTVFTTQVNGFAWNNTWNYWLAFGSGTYSVAISMDGINWTGTAAIASYMTSGGYAGLWHSGLRLWIVGGTGTNPYITSFDGYTWTVRTPGNLTSIYTVATDGYMILMGGIYSGTTCIVSSWDGITWTNRVATSLTTPYQIIWDQAVLTSGQFIAVGAGTTYPINVSSNGITWTTNTSITTGAMATAYGIVWASGFSAFVMVGTPGTTTIAVSTNLSSWSNYSSGGYIVNSLFSSQGYGVGWNGSAFILVGGTANTILYSPDGIKYRIVSSSTSGTSAPSGTVFTTAGYAVSWNPNYGVWIACGSGTYQIAYAFNGITGWTGVGSYFASTGYCLATNGVRTICGGDISSFNMIYTDDYVNWNFISTIISSIVYSASYGNNIWVIGGSGASYNLAYSYNGTSWVGASNFYGNAVSYITYCLGWNGSYFLAGGNCITTFQFATSFNGSNWQMAGSIPFSTAARCVTWSSNLAIWVAGGQGANTLAWSWDGVIWVGLGATTFSTICYGVTWNGSIFVATGSGTNTVATSFDGSNWIPRGNNYQFTSYARGVAYNPGTNAVVIGGTGGSNTLNQTTDLVSYNYFGSTVFTTGCYAVAWNGSYFLAGGAGLNTIASSPDGYTWTGRANTTTSVAMRAAGWNGSYWIGVGAAGSLSPFYRSADTVTWYQTTSYNPGTVYGVQWNGSYWLATSAANQVYQSSNGSFWIVRNTSTTPFSGQVNAVIWNGSYWVALGTGTVNTVATSTNGFFWIGHGIYPFSTAGWNAAWNGSYWVAVGAGTNTLAWSSNGSNWIGVGATIFTTAAYGVAWSPVLSLWVATGTGTNTIATSYTGLSNSWVGRNSYIMTPGYGIAWNGSLWVTTGSGTGVQIGTSPDGLVWSARSSNAIFSTAVNAVAWNGSYFVAVGAATTIATSYDGITWSPQSFSGFTTGWAVVWAYNLSLWIVIGAGGTYQIGTSGDGVNWTGRNPIVFTTAGYNAGWNGSYWVSVGTGTNSIASSTDGIVWIPRGTLSGTYFSTGGSNVIWSASLSQWLAVGAGTNAILTSPDGVNWTIRQVVGTAFGTGGYGVTYNTGVNTQYVAVGGPTYWVQVSPDGCNWTITNGSNIATTNIFALTTGPTGFMAVGNSSTYLSAWSSNGWNWSNTGTGLGVAVQTQCVTSLCNYWIAGTTAGLYYGTSNGSNNTVWTAAVGGNFYAAAASSTIAVTVTTGGTYYWSSNGYSWTALSNVFTYFSYILYANNLFIGVGSYIGYSSNGITWYPSLATTSLSASYGASTYVIGGASTTIYSSSTGLSNSWTAQTSQLSTSTRFILWDSYRSMFIATGAGVNIFQTSGNGITWTATHVSSNFVTTTAWFANYYNSSWTVVGGSGAANSVTIARTGDGVAFLQSLSNAFVFTLYSIAVNSSSGVSVAVGNQGGTAWAVYNSNVYNTGWNSNAIALGAGIYGYGVAFGQGGFCTVGGSASANLIYTNASGTGTWVLTSNTFSTMTYVTWTGWNLWIGVGTGSNAVAYSYDGVTWVGQGLNTWFTTGYGVVYNGQNNSVAVAVGTGTWQVIYTTNGTTWTGLTSSGIFTTAYSAVFNYQLGSFYIVGTGTYSLAYASWNGSTLFAPTGISNTGITTIRSIAINGTSGSYLVACANTTQLWYLNGSYVWTNSGTAFATSAQAIAWNGTYFVAVGLSAIYYSSTGTSWTSTGSAGVSYYSIAWNGTYWLAGYQSTTSFIAYSSTGTSAFTTGVTLISTMTIPYFLFWATTLNGGSGGWVATGSGTVTVAINYNSAGTGTWTSQGAPITTGYGISYNPNNGVYMLVGNGGNSIYTSTNCSNWTGYTGTTLMTTAYTVVYESASGSNIWCVGGVGNCSFMFTTDQLGQKDWNISNSNFRHTTTFFMVDSAYGPVTCGNGPNIAFGGYYSGYLQTANTMFTTGYAITIISGTAGGMIAVGSGGSNTILYNLPNSYYNAWSGAGIISLTTQGRGVALLSNNSINGIYPILGLGSGTYYSVMSLDNGISWSPPPTTSALYALAWNGSYWSMGGAGGNTTIMVGNSGSYPLTYFYGSRCWSLFTSVYGVCWNGNSSVFVAVGQGNNTVAISSDNGVTWRGRGTFGSAMFAIAWNGSYYVMTGSTATYYSSDAYTWTAATHPFTGTAFAVIWDGNNGRWMLGGNGTGTTIATSTLSPPSSWTAVASASVMGTVRGLGWNGTYYVAVGNGTNNIAWASSPGTSWTGLSTTYLTTSGYAVYWYNNAWIAVGQGTYNVAWSTNTVNWFNPIFQTNLRGFGWNGSYWIGVGAGGTTLARASSWNSWSNINSNASYITSQGYTAVWNPNGNYWLACGTGTNAIIYSGDGANWQVVSLTSAIFTTGCYGLAWNGSIWVAVGQGTTYVTATSSDGVNWTGRNILNTIFAAAYGITWNGTLWVALGSTGTYSIAYSYDGTTWFGVPGSANIFSTGYYVVWNGSYFVGVGTGTYCTAYSSDGVNWFGKALAASLLTTAYGVAWSGSIWVAVGQPGQSTIAYSYDGNLWQASVNGLTAITTTGYAIQWNGSYFMMSGLNGVYPQVTYSSDGVTWSVYQYASFSNQSATIYAITSGANGLLAVGAPGVSFAAQSYEGLTWWNYSNVVTPFTTLGTGAATNGSYILATGTGTTNSIAWSLDGTYWFGKGLLIAPSGSACNVAWNGSYWLIPTIYAAATLPGFAVRTYDNSNYDYVGIPGWTAGWNVTNINNILVAVGSNTSLRNPSYSVDGIGWTTRYSSQVIFTILGTSVSSNNGIWIVTGTGTNSHVYAYQSNGPWNVFPVANFFSTGAYGVAWNGTTWVMVGQGTTNTQITSSNGVVWIGRGISVFSTAGYSVNWNGSIFLATGTGTNITAISSDGLTWDITGKLPFSTGYCIATNSNGIYVATGVGVVASNAFAWSTDGSNWKQRVSSNTMFSTQGYSVSYNSNYSYWLAFGAGTNYVVKSRNGYDWFSQPWYGGLPLGITWNGSYFIAVGSGSNTIAYSSDGSNWYVATNTNIFTSSYCIAWNANNSFWVAGGGGNYVSAYSTNTSNFTGWATNLSAAWQIHSPFSSINAIAWNQGTNTLWVAAGAGTYTLGTSTDGSNWIGRSSTIFTSQGYTVGWNGTYWLAGGAGTNTIALSPDGSNWAVQATTSLFSTNCFVILWNGSYWVAGGQGTTTIAYGPSISSTNSNWYSVCTTSATMFTTYVYCLGWNGSYWLAGGTGGTQLTSVSSNGSNWWPQPFPGYGRGAAYNGSYWVAVGSSGSTIIKSSDAAGQVWFPVSSNTIFTAAYAVAWNGSYWVVGGVGSYVIATSSDGVNWTGRASATSIFGTAVYCLAWNSASNLWVAGGLGATYVTATSTDGVNWYGRMTTATLTAVWGVANNNYTGSNLWVATGTGGYTVAYSYDGSTWYQNTSQSLFSTQGYGVAFSSTLNLWLVGGAGSFTTWTSQDGIWWFARTASANSTASNYTGQPILFTTACYGVTWTGSQFIAFGAGSPYTIATSVNGIAWFPNSNTTYPTFSTWYAVGYGNGAYVGLGIGAVSNIGIANSINGTAWTLKTFIPFTGNCTGVAWNGSIWVAVGSGSNTFCTSADGVTWTPYGTLTQPFTTVAGGGAWNGVNWLAAGSGTNTMASSVDGNWWIGKGTAPLTSGSNVLYANGFIAYGSSTNYQVNTADLFNFNIVRKPDATTVYTLTSSAGGGAGLSIQWYQTTTDLPNVVFPPNAANGWGTLVLSGITTQILYGDGQPQPLGTYTVTGNSNDVGMYAYGFFNSPVADVLYVQMVVDDGGYVNINGVNVLNGWASQAATTYTGQANISAGANTIQILYSQGGGGATDQFYWQTNSSPGWKSNLAANFTSSAGGFGTMGTGGLAQPFYSSDGIGWYARYTTYAITTTNVYYITTINGTSYMVGYAGASATNPTINYSADGYVWVAGALGGIFGTSIFTYTIGYINGVYVIGATAGSHTAAISYDGFTWIPRGTVIFATTTYALLTSGSYLYAGGQGTDYITKTLDGSNWSVVGNRVFTSSYGVSWGSNVLVGSNLYVATGTSNFAAGQNIAYSYDGIGWATQINMNSATYSLITSTAYASVFVPSGIYGSYWIAVGAGTNKTVYSYDGLTWWPPAIPSGGQFCYWTGTYVVIGGSGAGTSLIFGTNGSNFQPGGTAAIFAKWWGIGWNGSIYVAVGTPAAVSYGNSNSSNTTIAYSSNLKSWFFAPFSSTIFPSGAYGVAWSSSLSIWVAVGGGSYTTATSSNGITWIGRAISLFTTAGYCVLWNSAYSIFVAGGYSTGITIAYSYDGVAWYSGATTALWGTSPAGCYGIAWNGSGYVAVGVGSTNTIAYCASVYPVTYWNGLGITIFTTQGNGIAWNSASNMWIAVGQGTNTIAYSTSVYGTSWTALSNSTSIFSTAGYGVAWNGSLWTITGVGTNMVAYSANGSNGWIPLTTTPFTTASYGVGTSGTYVVAVGAGSNTLATSFDGLLWAGFLLAPFPASGYGVAYGNGYWIVSGATNSIAYSSDGYNWEVVGGRQLLTTGQGLAYDGTKIVAVGTGTVLPYLYSYDGAGWRVRVTSNGNTFLMPFSNANYVSAMYAFNSNLAIGYGICYNGNSVQWVAVGTPSACNAAATIVYSPDGINWTPAYSNNNSNSNIYNTQALLNPGYGVTWNGSLYVAVGTSNAYSGIAYSYNGSNWFGINTPNFATGRAVAWNNSYFIATGILTCNVMFYSVDGVNWEMVGKPLVTTGYNVIWNSFNNSFILTGTGSNTWNSLLYSYDGFGWRSRIQTSYQFSTGYAINCNYWAPSNANYWLAGGAGQPYMTSYDGINWYSPFSYGYGVSWNGSYFLAFGGLNGALGSTIILSYDGFIWYNGRTGNIMFNTVKACLWNSSFGYWLAAGQGSIVVAYSTNGLDWSPRVGANQFFGTQGANGIVCNGSRWLILGSTTGSPNSAIIIFSTNSIDWYSSVSATISTLFTTGAFAGVWNGSFYVVTGQGAGNTMATSSDGSNWVGNTSYTIWSSSTPAGGYAVAWNGGSQYVVVGYGPATLVNTILYSSDGVNWYGAGASTFTTAGYGVIWASQCNAFVAVGAGTNSIAYSFNNGASWTVSSALVLFTNGARGLAYDGTKFVVTGPNGTSNIATSTDLINWIGRSYYGGYTSAGTMVTQYSVVWNNSSNFWFSGGNSAQMLFYSADGLMWLSNTSYTNYGNIGTAPGYALGCNGSYWIMAGGTAGNFYLSKDGFYWITVAAAPATNYQVMCNGTTLWGASGTSFSYDGIGWCPVINSPLTGYGIAYNGNNNRWVAVAATYTSVSVDGSNYFGSAFTTAGRAVFWDPNNAQFMTVGISAYTQILYGGAAGNYWYPSQTARQMINGAYGLWWDGSYYTVVGASTGTGATMQWSTDRVTWHNCSNSYLVMSNMYGITKGYAGRWVIAGQGSNTVLAYTSDLVNYFRVAGSTLFTIGYGVYWNGSLFIAVGSAGSSGSYTIASSPDGITWTGRANNALLGTGYCVTWNSTYNLWVAGGSPGAYCIATSPDGFTWTGRVNSSVFTTCYGVVWGIGGSTSGGGGPFGMFVAVGSGSATIATSFDGFTWTIRATSTLFSVAAYGVAFSGSVWVVVGGLTNTLATSSDGDNWMPWMSVPFSAGTGYAITYSSNYNIFVATGSGTNMLPWSYDGFFWQNTYALSGASNGTAIFATQGWSIAWTPNAMVASGTGNNVFAATAQGQSNWRAYSNALLESTSYGVATNG